MKKIIALLALFAFTAAPAFASLQFSQDDTRKGQYKKVNLTDGMTIDNDGDIELGALTPASVASVGAVSGTTGTFSSTTQMTVAYSTYYARLPYYSKLTMIGSGAPAGSILQRGGPASKNCGIGGDGTSSYLCVSDGSNWIPV